jgi:mRNA interferase YafQ
MTAVYRRDLKRIAKSGEKLNALKPILECLEKGEPLSAQYNDHPLVGNWKGHRELHIKPDWLLIYRVDGDIVYLTSTGSHAHLFKK